MRVENIQLLCLNVSYPLRKEMSLSRSNLSVSKLMMNCSSVSFLCFVTLKLPFKMQSLRLWMSFLSEEGHRSVQKFWSFLLPCFVVLRCSNYAVILFCAYK